MDTIDKTVKQIKNLQIQGASKIREKAVDSLVKTSTSSRAKSPAQFRKEFLSNSKKLFEARPTEPALRTALRIFKKSISHNHLNVEQMKKAIKQTDVMYDKEREVSLKKMSKYGAQLIKRNSVILTLCHSHSVIDVLIKAKNKIDQVYCCETRPLYQGRQTAKDLAEVGIDVTLLVDNAASTIMKECDYFFTGADAFLGDGDIVNKIGTNQISTLCKRYEVPHYAVCSTHKFEPSSFFGKDEPIEQRNFHEVLSRKIKGIKVMNPAFDRTDSSLIGGIVCEKGVFPPEVLASKLYDKLNLDKHETDFLKL